MAVSLILTAIGEIAGPTLIREGIKLGGKQFIQKYGLGAWTSISTGVTGGIIAQETPPLDLQNEKLFGTPIGSLPGMPATYYDDTTEKDKEKEVSTEVKDQQPKLPEEEPPEGPDVDTDLAAEAAVQSKKLLEDKELDVSKQTENLTSKIKNKITTWEYVTNTREEFKKLAEENKLSFEELEKGAIKNQITFKRISTSNYNVYYDGKEIASLDAMEEKYKGVTEYMIKFIGDKDTLDVGTGLAESKDLVKKFISNGLLDKSEPDLTPGYYWQPLRKIFQEATFDKKGNYIEYPEDYKE